MTAFFKQTDRNEVLASVERRWDLSGMFPLPKWDIECPVCRSTEIQAGFWQFFQRQGGGTPFRCDVRVKCRECSHAFIFGITIPEMMFRLHVSSESLPHIKRMYPWREVRQIMESGGTLPPPPTPIDMSRMHSQIGERVVVEVQAQGQ